MPVPIQAIFLFLYLAHLPISSSFLVTLSHAGSMTSTLTTKTKTKASATATATRIQIPKEETDVMDLLAKNPTYDGRGIRMAILDTGCDLAARGLETTSTGEPKYLDFIDCTGDGDVDMTTQKEVAVVGITTKKNDDEEETKNVTVTGVSGKTLQLPVSILTEAKHDDDDKIKVRLGAMPLYRILPKSALGRVKEERKTKFVHLNNVRMAKAQTTLDQLRVTLQQKQHQQQQQQQSTSNATTTTSSNSTHDDDNTLLISLKKQIKEQETLLDELQAMMQEDYNDAGPVMDVVLYSKNSSNKNSMIWQALVDVHANGDLTHAIPMTPYAVQRQFGTFSFGSHVTFCIQVYQGGDILSLVCDAGSHGTHVAGIAAASYNSNNENDNTQQDGVAPGAQILACKIGDVRLSSAETGVGLIRALVVSKKYKCHLVNLSFGEPSWQPDSGRVAQVFDDAVHKWGLTIFTSAGNDGPALSTLGSPGTLSSLITVGAYVSPQMMRDQYSTLTADGNKEEETTDDMMLPGASYSFSSRGPTPDGYLPDICAPGGAIAAVPRHTLQGKSQKHGTSMASPSACGVAAVVLSALKSKGINIENEFGPNELRRALVNSALNNKASNQTSNNIVLDPFAQGAGLISARRAIDYALAHHGKAGQDLFFDIKIPEHQNARGIFIRDALQLAGPMTKTVSVKPRFEHSLEKTTEEMDELLSLELELDLVPSEKWVYCPDRMTLLSTKERNAGQSFAVRLDPRGLPPGAHYATVDAIDSKDPARGPLFQVPITVIVPHAIVHYPPFKFADDDGEAVQATKVLESDSDHITELSTTTHDNGIDVGMRYDLTPGAPQRRFLTVPASAEWAAIKVRSVSPNASNKGPHTMILHAVPFARGDLHNKMIQIKKFFRLNEGTERVFYIQVKGGSTLEVCLQLSWLANPSPVSVETDIEFHSLDVRPPTLVSTQPVRISAATEYARIGVGAPFRAEKISPKATLASVYRTIRPKEYKISAASSDDRDILPLSDAEISGRVCTIGDEENSQMQGTLIYKSQLEYVFKLSDSKEDSTISVTPRIPSLFNQIYDSPIDSQLWMLQDKSGKILGYGGCMHEADAVKLNSKPGGEYKLTLRISHPNRKVLEQLKDLPLRLSMKMTKELDCAIYNQLDKASTPGVTDDGRQQVKEVQLLRGSHYDLYVARPIAKVPDWVEQGDVMFGKVKLNQNDDGAIALDLFYEIPPKSAVSDGNKKDDDKKIKKTENEEKNDEDDLCIAIFEAKVGHLKKLRTKKKTQAYETLANELKQEKSDNLSLLEELLTNAKDVKVPDDETENEKRWRALEVSKAVDAMKNSNGGPVDEAAIAQYYGCNNPLPEDDEDGKEAAEKIKKDMEEQRKAWRSALLAKAGAWSDTMDQGNDKVTVSDKNTFDAAVNELKKWASAPGDLSTDKEKVRHAVVLSRQLSFCQGKPISAAASLRKIRKDLAAEFHNEVTQELVKILKDIDGMEYWLQQISQDMDDRYPKAKPTL